MPWGVAAAVVGAGASIYGSKKAAKAAEESSEASVAEQRRQFDLVRGDTAPYREAGNAALDTISRLYGLGTNPTPAPQPLSYEQYSQQHGFNGGGGEMSGLMHVGGDTVQRVQYQNYLNGLPKTGTPTPRAPDMSAFFESPDYQFNLGEGQKAIDRSLASRGRALSGAGVREGVRYASGMASNQFGDFYNRLASIAGIGQAGVSQSAAAGANAAGNIGAAYQNAGNARASAYAAGNAAIQGTTSNLLTMYLAGNNKSSGSGLMANNYRGPLYGGGLA